MSSRQHILANIKKKQPAFASVPDVVVDAIRYPDLFVQFSTVLTTIGGTVLEATSVAEITQQIRATFPTAKRIVAIGADLNDGANAPLASDPHELENVDVAVLQGLMGVAENGAIWIADRAMGDRALPFICQHLVLIISKGSIVNNLQEAYQKIGNSSYALGTFIAGPSKTADIEQSLVLGAHGAKSLTVFVLT